MSQLVDHVYFLRTLGEDLATSEVLDSAASSPDPTNAAARGLCEADADWAKAACRAAKLIAPQGWTLFLGHKTVFTGESWRRLRTVLREAGIASDFDWGDRSTVPEASFVGIPFPAQIPEIGSPPTAIVVQRYFTLGNPIDTIAMLRRTMPGVPIIMPDVPIYRKLVDIHNKDRRRRPRWTEVFGPSGDQFNDLLQRDHGRAALTANYSFDAWSDGREVMLNSTVEEALALVSANPGMSFADLLTDDLLRNTLIQAAVSGVADPRSAPAHDGTGPSSTRSAARAAKLEQWDRALASSVNVVGWRHKRPGRWRVRFGPSKTVVSRSASHQVGGVKKPVEDTLCALSLSLEAMAEHVLLEVSVLDGFRFTYLRSDLQAFETEIDRVVARAGLEKRFDGVFSARVEDLGYKNTAPEGDNKVAYQAIGADFHSLRELLDGVTKAVSAVVDEYDETLGRLVGEFPRPGTKAASKWRRASHSHPD